VACGLSLDQELPLSIAHNFYSRIADDLLPSVVSFLSLSEGMEFSRVNLRTYAKSKFLIKELSVAASRINEVMSRIQFSKFPLLRSLQPKGENYPAKIVFPNGVGRIKRLSFFMISRSYIPIANELIEQIPGLESLSLACYSPQVFFEPECGKLSAAAKANIVALKELDFSGATVHVEGVSDTLLGLTQLTSVNLNGQLISNAIFRELVRNRSLSILSLQDTKLAKSSPHIDYELLALCCTLERFAPGKEVTTNALRAILSANAQLVHLDLSSCLGTLVEDVVLQQIGSSNRGLQSIAFPRPLPGPSISGRGWMGFTGRCMGLVSLHVRGFSWISREDLIVGMSQCNRLQELKLEDIEVTDDLLRALSQKTTLKTLIIMNPRS
jgi:hypothetical protein